jgi:hypothetical protein
MSSDDMFESSVSSAFDADERRRIAGAVELVHLGAAFEEFGAPDLRSWRRMWMPAIAMAQKC